MENLASDGSSLIEEFSQEELDQRRLRSNASKASAQSRTRSRPSTTGSSTSKKSLKTENHPIHPNQPHTTSVASNQSAALEQAASCTSVSPNMVEIELNEQLEPSMSEAGWPGHVLDIDFLHKGKDEYSASREGHLLVDLISNLIFLWGLSSSPLQSMKQSIKAEIASAKAPPKPAPLMDVFEDVFEDDLSESSQEAAFPSNPVDSVDEFGIEVYGAPQKSEREKLKFEAADDEDEFGEEPEVRPSRLKIRKLELKEKHIDSVYAQLDTLRRLIFEDVHQSPSDRQTYLSHIFLFVGASVHTSKFAFCLTRSLHESREPLPIDVEDNSSLPGKTRADDSWIRSILRSLLQYDIGTASIRPARSRMANRISLVVAYSALPQANSEAPSQLQSLSESLVPLRISDKWYSKWSPKKPLRTIRIGTSPDLVASTPAYSGRIGEPLSLL